MLGGWFVPLRHDATRLLRQGLSPRSIAVQMGKTTAQVREYLLLQVGEGDLRCSEILFAIDEPTRLEYQRVHTESPQADYWTLIKRAEAKGHSSDEFRLYLDIRKPMTALGDMYDYIASLELSLHDAISRTLKSKYGSGLDGWWREGVPQPIREECAAAHERNDKLHGDPWSFATFTNLATVIEKNWELFSRVLPFSVCEQKKQFLADLRRTNGIRNGVMHPLKRLEIADEDFLFVMHLEGELRWSKWRQGAAVC
jgi:hypothetical protein